MTLLLELLRRFWPYVLAATIASIISATTAWKVQGMRLTAAEQEFVQYKQDQKDAAQAAKDRADKQREVAANEYKILKAKLSAEIKAGEVYRRCVAAGRCGGVSVQSSGPGLKVPPASGIDDPGPDAVPSAPGATAEVTVVEDCAITTLMLNQLQADIEAQP